MASINPIASPSELYQATKISPSQNADETMPDAGFKGMLSNAIAQADQLSTVSQEGTQALLAGEVDNIAQVMIDGTKSELALNMVIQVRNKVVDAYNEVMRMSL